MRYDFIYTFDDTKLGAYMYSKNMKSLIRVWAEAAAPLSDE